MDASTFEPKAQYALIALRNLLAEQLWLKGREYTGFHTWETLSDEEKAPYVAQVTDDMVERFLLRLYQKAPRTPEQETESIALRNFLLEHTNPDQARVEPQPDPHRERTELLMAHTHPQYQS